MRCDDSADGRSRRLPVVREVLAAAGVLLAATACGDTAGPEGPEVGDASATLECDIPRDQIRDGGVGRDGIPALSNPGLIPADEIRIAPDHRVVGLRIAGRTIAVPHNILWWHEVVNFTLGSKKIAVTHCPLTGSTLVFSGASLGEREYVVSGLLYRNNLIMTVEHGRSLLPQMSRRWECGERRGQQVDMVAAVEMEWSRWKSLHPGTEVVSPRATGFVRPYNRYPYGDYRGLHNDETLFPVSRMDERRPPKERVLGIPDGEGGLAVPFGALADSLSTGAVDLAVAGDSMVVLWTEEARGAAAYRPRATLPSGESRAVELAAADGRIVDRSTNSTWTLDGRAVEGPLEGAELKPVESAYVAYWFAWALFQPETRIWPE